MSNKVFVAILAILVIGLTGAVVVNRKNEPKKERPGIAQEDKGKSHIPTTNQPNVGGEPPTSGDHDASPLPWQAYDQEVPDAKAVHNLEHGGIYISYRPDLPPEQINKIKALFTKPFSRKGFSPNKVIIGPRAANSSPIVMSSWARSLKLDAFDEQVMVDYYLRNVSKSPEPAAS